MLRERVAVILIILPFILWVVVGGGWLYLLAILTVLCLAVVEFGLMFRGHGLRPALPLLVSGVAILVVARFLFGFKHTPLLLASFCLISQVWHLVDYERGATHSGTDFAITIAGVMYVGFVGSYLISLRLLPEGLWWLLVALPSIWMADAAAYVFGRVFGRHKLSQRISPKKTWEGYLSGVVIGALGTAGLTMLWRTCAGSESTLTPVRGLIVGLTISSLAPLGDLGISMIKREFQAKDTGSLLPGHGGVLDRLDSMVWAGVLGFYVISWLIS
ncbi:MAG TPA: phosphatidate cytidylyltransferase [Anaerolineae bacterium]|nr:phosphatidate cytidylyltransferase [Anaerolineae bacterium]